MPKFTLICDYTEDSQSNHVITHEFNTVYLPDVLQHFEDFLKGCGYQLSGNVDIVSPDEYIEPQHSEYYFDAERNK